jgi:hypothetical protein
MIGAMSWLNVGAACAASGDNNANGTAKKIEAIEFEFFIVNSRV